MHEGDVIPNVWWGTTVENQQRADERIPMLMQVPAAIRFVSYEPALSSLDLNDYLPINSRFCQKCGYEPLEGMQKFLNLHGINAECPQCGNSPIVKYLDWVIIGAESGQRRRPMRIEWVHDIAKQCINARVPLFYKQGPDDYGNEFVKMPTIYGRTYDQFPVNFFP